MFAFVSLITSLNFIPQALASHNGLKGKLIVLPGKIEEIELPEKVDAIVSEPMVIFLDLI
jgi:hypothetical protein